MLMLMLLMYHGVQHVVADVVIHGAKDVVDANGLILARHDGSRQTCDFPLSCFIR